MTTEKQNEFIIAICPNHSKKVPLIWTLIFPESVYWCPHCGYKTGMFGICKTASATPKLKKRKDFYRQISKPFLAGQVGAWLYGDDKPRSFAIIDLETGGFSKTKNGICEIAVIIADEQKDIVYKESFILKPYLRADGQDLVSYKDDAMSVHGITMGELYGGVAAEELGEFFLQLFELFGTDTIIGHCAKTFDMPWFNEFMRRFGAGFSFTECIDTRDLFKKINGAGDNSLPEACSVLMVDHKDAHRAMPDAEAAYEIWKILG
jgi:DNA polymerase III epsilon subunit-like protein